MKTFLSSTYIDLVEHRKASVEALERLGEKVGRMEVFGARPEEPTRACLRELEDCDLFVGIYAHRYGCEPEGDLSITELEFDHAKKHRKPMFCFVLEENYPWPPQMIQANPAKSKLLRFKEKKIGREFARETFTSPDQLAARVATAIGRYLVEQQDAAIRDAHARALTLTVSRDHNLFSLWAANGGTHVIRDIEINAIPEAEDWHENTHGRLPKLGQTEVHGVEVVYPILGGWFHAKVSQLNPNRGFMIASFEIEHRDYTRFDIDVSWNDHTGMQRKSHAVVDVGSVTKDLPLQPRG